MCSVFEIDRVPWCIDTHGVVDIQHKVLVFNWIRYSHDSINNLTSQ